jgi:DNA-binding NarL/FixJ family response regulator
MGTAASQIVVLDMHPMWLDCVRSVMTRFGLEVVAATTDPDEALAAVAEHRPRLFVLDPAVHDGKSEWLALVDEAIALAPGLKVVAMSQSGDQDAIEAAFDAGVSAYVVKTASESDIGAALRLAVTTAIHVSTGAQASNRPHQPDETEALTRREFEILALVTEGHSNAAIGRKLWVTEQTVKFHLSNLYRKIGVRNRTAAARWAELHGVVPIDGTSAEDEHVAAGSAA